MRIIKEMVLGLMLLITGCSFDSAGGTSSETKNTIQLAKVSVNTTNSGIPIQDTLYKTPVLMRINNTEINFSNCLPTGKDFFITNETRDTIPFQIEKWDPATMAEIWVLLDTIFPAVNKDVLNLFCDGTADLPFDQGDVFLLAQGFQQVFHLDSNSSLFSLDTSLLNNISSGLTGMGLSLDGQADYLDVSSSLSALPDTFFVTGWFHFQEAFSRTSLISLLAENPMVTQSLDIILDGQILTLLTLGQSVPIPLTFSIQPNSWHQLGFLYIGGDKLKIYWDGVPIHQQSLVGINITAFDRILIGKSLDHLNMNLFKGIVDELRVVTQIKSDDWIKLNYQNQLPNEKLIEINNP